MAGAPVSCIDVFASSVGVAFSVMAWSPRLRLVHCVTLRGCPTRSTERQTEPLQSDGAGWSRAGGDPVERESSAARDRLEAGVPGHLQAGVLRLAVVPLPEGDRPVD